MTKLRHFSNRNSQRPINFKYVKEKLKIFYTLFFLQLVFISLVAAYSLASILISLWEKKCHNWYGFWVGHQHSKAIEFFFHSSFFFRYAYTHTYTNTSRMQTCKRTSKSAGKKKNLGYVNRIGSSQIHLYTHIVETDTHKHIVTPLFVSVLLESNTARIICWRSGCMR